MGKRKLNKSVQKRTPSVRKSDAITSEFSRSFEKKVAPRLTPEKADLIRQTFNYDYIRSLSQGELSNLVRQLSIMANQRIGIYKNTKYYKETLKGWTKPIPAAYRILEENKGDIEKFDLSKIPSMSLSKLRKEVSILGHFLSSESSYASLQQEIMKTRYQNMTEKLKLLLPVKERKNFDKNYKDMLMSDEFQRKFWEIYNKVTEREGGKEVWYQKEQFMSEITAVFTTQPKYGLSVDELVEYIRKKVNEWYEQKDEESRLQDNPFTKTFTAGSNK